MTSVNQNFQLNSLGLPGVNTPNSSSISSNSVMTQKSSGSQINLHDYRQSLRMAQYQSQQRLRLINPAHTNKQLLSQAVKQSSIFQVEFNNSPVNTEELTCEMKDILHPMHDLGVNLQQAYDLDELRHPLQFVLLDDAHPETSINDYFDPANNNPFDKHDPYSFKSAEEIAVFRTALQHTNLGAPAIAHKINSSEKNNMTISRNKTAEAVRKYELQLYFAGQNTPEGRQFQVESKQLLINRFHNILSAYSNDHELFSKVQAGEFDH